MQRQTGVGSLALVATMAALGNVLGVVPIGLAQIPIGAGVGQVALDFSNLAIVVVSILSAGG